MKIKNDLGASEILANLTSELKQVRLEGNLAKRSFQYDIEEPFEAVTKSVNEINANLLEKPEATTAATKFVFKKFSGASNELAYTQKTLNESFKAMTYKEIEIKSETSLKNMSSKTTDCKNENRYMLKPEPRYKVLKNEDIAFFLIRNIQTKLGARETFLKMRMVNLSNL